MKKIAFCIHCGEFRDYRVRSCIARSDFNNVTYRYLERNAFCNTCDALIYIPSINDMNVEAAERAYKRAKEDELFI